MWDPNSTLYIGALVVWDVQLTNNSFHFCPTLHD
jgi:hypothetical protein